MVMFLFYNVIRIVLARFIVVKTHNIFISSVLAGVLGEILFYLINGFISLGYIIGAFIVYLLALIRYNLILRKKAEYKKIEPKNVKYKEEENNNKFESKLEEYLFSIYTCIGVAQEHAFQIAPEQSPWLFNHQLNNGIGVKIAAVILYNTKRVAHLSENEIDMLDQEVIKQFKGIGTYYESYYNHISIVEERINDDNLNLSPEEFRAIIGINVGHWLGGVIEQEYKAQGEKYEFTNEFLQEIGVFIIEYVFRLVIPLIDNYEEENEVQYS